ncbi:hypothetical protein M409DRAFT_37137 [Zasmidium cellare ATCC 36951]|uniref:Ergosterol biosynthesis protein n=1 Tax=Zasmidium cellare ATCC 36951 TaxID=1080233 RepID=A0A6A6CDQ3_ZASCE|nr:uncharacterized protein M409DRAFT_37137 [Zasmidium cellare ATCC 36951]KAF2164042.1 hypothetical protein M409DRAFT_37137 [Zasmidium cellare ATCC 36951]
MSSLGAIGSYLPPSDGLLPKWLLFIAVVSIGNSVQAYVSLAGTREVYSGSSATTTQTTGSGDTKTSTTSPVNELSARTFGTWTALSSIVRLYTAYNIHDPLVYQLCLWTYGLAFAHFVSEWLVFGSAKWGRGLVSPLIVSTVTGVWMLSQWDSYVR